MVVVSHGRLCFMGSDFLTVSSDLRMLWAILLTTAKLRAAFFKRICERPYRYRVSRSQWQPFQILRCFRIRSWKVSAAASRLLMWNLFCLVVRLSINR